MNNEKSNKILVIGGNGFIGSNIVNYLKTQNLDVAVYDVYPKNLEGKQYVGDIFNDPNFDAILSQYDKIIYLITSVSPKKSMDDPNAAYITDIPLLLKTLDSCIKNNIKRIIYASSGGTVYGENGGKRSSEEDVTNPINHYAICKISCEKILQLYNSLYNMENIVLRISNPYGIGQNPNSGVGVITTFATQILENKPITLYGDGNYVRDFVNIEAVAKAFYLSLYWKLKKDVAPIFNVGSGVSLSLNQIINIIAQTLEIDSNISYLPARPFDLQYNCLDTSKIENEMGFQTPIDQKNEIREYVMYLKSTYGKIR